MSRTILEAESALESLVDEFGMRAVLYMLEGISRAKTDHLRSNWQDAGAAQAWERASKVLDKAAAHNSIVKVSP